jgi:hypothetical protein
MKTGIRGQGRNYSESLKLICVLSIGLLGACASGIPVQEIGSFHVGGRPVTLSGLPVREIVFTAGAPPFRSDPNGDFETGGDLPKLRGTPHLFVWGDYLDQQDLWKKIDPAVNRYRDGLRAAGVRADEFHLPRMGIRGNSHMLMMDRNSDEVAALIQRWLEQNGLTR